MASSPISGYLLRIILIATLGGLLFGYDTAVISGAIVFLVRDFELSAAQEGWAVGCAILGCIAGVGVAGYLSDRFGRRRGLMVAASLFLISAVGSALPDTLSQFVVARILGGMGIGVASMLGPVYIAEVAPPDKRGRLVALNQMAIVTGMLITYFSNYALVDTPNAWRWMLGLEAIPAAAFLLLLFAIPKTPRWLYLSGQRTKAVDVLHRIGGAVYAQGVIDEIRADEKVPPARMSDLFNGPLRKALVVGVVLAIFQQITGINAILYYTPKIFLEAGWASTEDAFGTTLAVGGVNFFFTLVALRYIDTWGRRPLLLGSVAGMAVFLVLLTVAFYVGTFPPIITVLALLGYVAFFVMGLGPGYWVLMAEIFPNAIRGRAAGLATMVLWISAYLVAQFFPLLLERAGPVGTFGLFAFFTVLSLIFIARFVPETRNKTLEEIRMMWEEK